MYTHKRLVSVAVLVGMTAAASFAQSVVSAHSGTLHYFDGDVSIDGQSIQSKVGKFSEIKENSVLRTGLGRAEVLLTPGVFLRVGENSSIKMLDNRLLSTRVEVISGTALVESDDPEVSVKDPAVTIVYKDYQIQPVKYGIFEITSDPSQMKVFKGQASVVAGSNKALIKEGRLMPFEAALVSEKFNEKQADDLYLWARDRSAYLSAANMSSARSLASNGYSPLGLYGNGYPGLGFNDRFQGGWYYNPYLSMYTYMPYGGTMWSPFGYGYFSPYTIYGYYTPGNYYWNGGGTRTSAGVPLSNIGTSTLAASQVIRAGSGTNTHPTLGSPVRSSNGFSGTNGAATGGFRGGFNDGMAQRGGNSNPGFASVGNAAPSNSGGFSPAVSAGGMGSGGMAPGGGAAGAARVGGGARGK